MKYSIAILYICIGKYRVFWDDFYKSSEKSFCEEHHKEYFIFTDFKGQMIGEETGRVHKIYQNDLGWPDNSLKRFDMFISIEKELKNFTFCFFFNANMLFVDKVDNSFLPIKEDFTLVEHFLFFNQTPIFFSYDRNPKSTAYIPYWKGRYYVRGGVNGGKTEKFLEMIHVCSKDVKKNEEMGIVSIWHDETHLNHFMLMKTNIKVLDPGFSYAEDDTFEGKIFILAREKKKYFDVNTIKSPPPSLSYQDKNSLNAIDKINKKLKLFVKILLSIFLFPRVLFRIKRKYKKINWKQF